MSSSLENSHLHEHERAVAVEPSLCTACAVRGLTFCEALGSGDLTRLVDIAQPVRIEPGQPLFTEDEASVALFNIVSGTIKLYKLLPDGRRQITGFLGSGDFLGLPFQETHIYSAETVTASSLCRFPRKRLEALLDDSRDLQRRLLSMMCGELAAAQEQMLLLGRKTAKEKICSFLCLLSQRAARRGHKDNPLHVPMSRTDIADYLGLTTETVSRTFTQLKTSGVISLLEGNKVLMSNIDAIADMADGC